MGLQRIQRLLHLITLLQSGGEFKTIYDLMAELDVSRSTLFRDLKMLDEVGIPYVYSPSKGYRIVNNCFLQPVNLTMQETLSLLMVAKSYLPQRGRAMIGSTLSAIWKLVSTIPEPIRADCSDMVETISVSPERIAISDNEDQLFLSLQRCIDERTTVDLDYQHPITKDISHYKVNPYHLHFSTRAWYLFGYIHEFDEVRILKLARIKRFEMIKKHFAKPKFDLNKQLGDAWQLINEGKSYNVELVFEPMVAVNVAEVRWHHTQKVKFQDDGKATVTFKVDGLKEIAWWICGYADQVRVIKPKALADRVRQMHLDAAAKQQKNSDKTEPEGEK
ncbi:MAG: helix-turn-helix transcriptional regulator [Phycisphaeraceae bacterium JB051]